MNSFNSFWPEGLSVSDVQSPYEILESAREEWETESKGVLTLVLQRSEPEDGNAIITVHAKHIPTNRTAALFYVIHRQKAPYPVTIQPKKENDIPRFLKKSYYVPSTNFSPISPIVEAAELAFVNTDIERNKRKLITNDWVSDTPSEFRENLADAFNLSGVKAIVLNLTSSKAQSGDDDNEVQE